MSKVNPRRGFFGSIGTAVLGSLCLGGALAYVFAVGGSLMAQQQPDPPAGPEVDTVSELSSLPEAPVGRLQIHVIDQGRAYIQNLTCEGDLESDPAACAEVSRIGAEQAEGEGGVENPFAEVDGDAVCAEEEYGPQEAFITGVWAGEEIDTEVTRIDSCEEARWQRLRPVTDPLG